MCIHFGTEYRRQQAGHPRRLNLPETGRIQRRNNPVLPVTAISDLADTVELSYYEICALQRHQYLASANGKYTNTVTIDIHLQEG
jgi:hypothetical protein